MVVLIAQGYTCKPGQVSPTLPRECLEERWSETVGTPSPGEGYYRQALDLILQHWMSQVFHWHRMRRKFAATPGVPEEKYTIGGPQFLNGDLVKDHRLKSLIWVSANWQNLDPKSVVKICFWKKVPNWALNCSQTFLLCYFPTLCTEVKGPIDKVFVCKLKSQSWKTWEIIVMVLRKEANPLPEDTDTETDHLFSLEKE